MKPDAPVRVAIAGSTGSIGTQTIEVVLAERDRYEVVALGVGSSVDALIAQAQVLRPRLVAVADPAQRIELDADLGTHLLAVQVVGEFGQRFARAGQEDGIVAMAPYLD